MGNRNHETITFSNREDYDRIKSVIGDTDNITMSESYECLIGHTGWLSEDVKKAINEIKTAVFHDSDDMLNYSYKRLYKDGLFHEYKQIPDEETPYSFKNEFEDCDTKEIISGDKMEDIVRDFKKENF